MNTFSIILSETFQPSDGGPPCELQGPVATCLTELEAKLQAAEYNIKRTEGQYYSIRME
jgi:hypothetical protein